MCNVRCQFGNIQFRQTLWHKWSVLKPTEQSTKRRHSNVEIRYHAKQMMPSLFLAEMLNGWHCFGRQGAWCVFEHHRSNGMAATAVSNNSRPMKTDQDEWKIKQIRMTHSSCVARAWLEKAVFERISWRDKSANHMFPLNVIGMTRFGKRLALNICSVSSAV